MHVHIDSAEKYAKFWLDPILLAESDGYLSKQLKEIREPISVYRPIVTHGDLRGFSHGG